MRRAILTGIFSGALTLAANAQVYELTAIDSKSMDPNNNNWNDNRLRAYFNGTPVDGFVKFDLSEIPPGAQITSMTLRTFHEANFGSPFDNPEAQLFRVADDGWSRNQSDPHPGFDEALTEPQGGFPTGNLDPWDWEIDVSAVDWSRDINDGFLSLAMRNINQHYSYVYWYGSDLSPAPPVLIIEAGGLSLEVAGDCPGQMTASAGGATPGGTVAFIRAFGTGSCAIPSGPCQGTILGLACNSAALIATDVADANGNASISGQAPAAACGRTFVQALDLDTCTTSNVESL